MSVKVGSVQIDQKSSAVSVPALYLRAPDSRNRYGSVSSTDAAIKAYNNASAVTGEVGGTLLIDPDSGTFYVVDTSGSPDLVATVGGTPDFSTTGIKADLIAESTASAGVTVDGLLIIDGASVSALSDPGSSAAIPVARSASVAITTGGSGETNTLAAPGAEGMILSLTLDVDGGGDRVVTASAGINATGNNTLTFADAGDTIQLIGVQIGGALVWRVLANEGVALSTV